MFTSEGFIKVCIFTAHWLTHVYLGTSWYLGGNYVAHGRYPLLKKLKIWQDIKHTKNKWSMSYIREQIICLYLQVIQTEQSPLTVVQTELKWISFH